MKYYLLMYSAAAKYPDLFDSVAVSADYYPNTFLGNATSKNGAITPIWGDVVPYVICKDANPTQAMTDATNAEAEAWNVANPTNQTGAMKLVFTYEERFEIAAQLKARQDELINV